MYEKQKLMICNDDFYPYQLVLRSLSIFSAAVYGWLVLTFWIEVNWSESNI